MSIEAIEGYIKHQGRRGLVASSSQTRLCTLRQFGRWLGNDRSLLTASRHEVESWLDSKHLKPVSRAWHLTNLTSFFRWAVLEGYAAVDPTERIIKPRRPRYVPRPIEEAELQQALASADRR